MKIIYFILLLLLFLSCSNNNIFISNDNINNNDNCYLANIIIENCSLNEKFDKNIFHYTVNLSYNINSFVVYPIKDDIESSILFKYNGKIIENSNLNNKYLCSYICSELKDSNEIEITVFSKDKSKQKQYFINISKEFFIKIASWNIRDLGDSRDNNELSVISSILYRYDLIAIQEVNSKSVLDKIITKIPDYKYIVTNEKVGTTASSSQKEYYAFLYKKSLIDVIEYYVFNDQSDDFIREPFIAYFKSGNFDFILATIHIIFGTSENERKKEIRKLDELIKSIENKYKNEKDIMIMGDFNMDASSDAWEIETHFPLINKNIKTTVKDVSSYDNIWINKLYTKEFKEFYEVYKFDYILYNGDFEKAKKEVSDHRPISALFSITGIDDD